MNMIRLFRAVFSNIGYIVLTALVTAAVLAFAIWLPNFSLLGNILVDAHLTFAKKIAFVVSSLGAYFTNFTAFSRAITTVVAVLFGINVSIFVFYMKRRTEFFKQAGVSAGGFIAGILGVGCASCGSVILTSLFGASGAVSFLGFLPLQGLEFSIVSIALLLFSIAYTAKKCQDPLICKISAND